MEREPNTLQEAIRYFSEPANCREYLSKRRWPNGVECPRCGSRDVLFLEKYNRWHCRAKHAAPQFTLKTQTFMEDSPIGLDKWLMAMWQIVNCKNGISSCELAKNIGVTQKTAWFMLHRIRYGMQDRKHGGGKLGGRVEVDETFIGGKARNMRVGKRKALAALPNGERKTIVLGMLERGGKVRTSVVPNREGATLQPIIHEHVRPGSKIMSDEHSGYLGLEDRFLRGVVNHAVEYVNGSVHTNGMENFWSLLKRGLGGTYVSVEPFHLYRYVDEQAFRFNNRNDGQRKDANGRPFKCTDAERLDVIAGQTAGKRLTYANLTGKERPEAAL